MPILMSLKALQICCPNLAIDPIGPATSSLSAANGSPLELVGSVDLHFRFSGPSIGSHEQEGWAHAGPVMQHWYPVCAVVFRDLSTPYIMSASLLRVHLMQISYADNPGPTVAMEGGERFPFLHSLQVRNDNGQLLYPMWQLWGEYRHKFVTHVKPELTEPLLQEDGHDPLLRGGWLDQ